VLDNSAFGTMEILLKEKEEIRLEEDLEVDLIASENDSLLILVNPMTEKFETNSHLILTLDSVDGSEICTFVSVHVSFYPTYLFMVVEFF